MLEVQARDLLVSQWDDAKAAGMSEPERLLYRSNLLGADKRITNYGGGNTSAKVMEKDPLTGEAVEVLWVKGSGGDVGTMKLDGFATLYMAKLEALKGLYRGLAHEDEMVGYLPHCTFDLNPRAASIDTPLHAFVPRRHVDHMHADAIIAIAASKDSKALTQEIFGDEIGWLPWKRPGFELGLWLEKFARENPEREGRGAREPRALHLGRHREGVLRDDARDHQPGDRLARRSGRRASRRSAASGSAALPAAERRAVAARLMPAIRGMVSKEVRMVGHFDDQPAVLEFVGVEGHGAAGGARDELPGPFPAHEDPAAGGGLRPGEARRRGDARGAAGGGRGVPRGLPRLLRALEAPGQPGAARPERGRLPGAGRRDDHLRQGQGDGADLGRVLRQRDQRDARGVGGLASTAGCRSRRPSTSSTGCSRRRSCSGCRSRRASPGGSPSSPAAPAGSARRRPSASCARAPAWCSPTSTRRRWRRSAAGFAARHGKDVVRTVEMNVTDEAAVARGLCRDGGRARRRRHRGLERRHRLVGADRGDDAGALGQEHVDPLDRLFPRLARGVPDAAGAGDRRGAGVRRLEERARGLAERLGLLHGEGLGDPPRALPGARRGARRASGSTW